MNFDCGSVTTASIFLPSKPPLALISSSASCSASISDFSLMAIVPVCEWRMPTLITLSALALPLPPRGQPARSSGKRAIAANHRREYWMLQLIDPWSGVKFVLIVW